MREETFLSPACSLKKAYARTAYSTLKRIHYKMNPY